MLQQWEAQHIVNVYNCPLSPSRSVVARTVRLPPTVIAPRPRTWPVQFGSGPTVPGLAHQLVPIRAVAVRICNYQARRSGQSIELTLAAHGVLADTSLVAKLESATNELAAVPPSALNDQCGFDWHPAFSVTFADALPHIVTVRDELGCGSVTNGSLVAQGTPKWHDLLQHCVTDTTAQ